MTVCLKIGVWLSIGLLLSPVAFGVGPEAVERLVLAKEGKTDYQIVISARTPKNIWDGQFLAWFLKEKTGATFPVVGARSYNAKKPTIFVGTSSALLAAVDPQPFAGMKDQDHVVRSHGRDIVLYGKGFDADFYAIVEFLDRCLGFRVYQKSVAPRIEKTPTVELKPFDYRLGWALTYRTSTAYSFTDYFRGVTDYGYRVNRESGGSFSVAAPKFSFSSPYEDHKAIQPQKRMLLDSAHTSLGLIPSATRAGYKAYPFVGTNDYFQAHPEYFYMDRSGKRTDDFVCWSNPGMRRQMKANLEKLYASLGTDDGIVPVSMADGVDVCHCPDCTALAKKYGTPGAAYFDFLCELGEDYLTTHPDTVISASFYHETQTMIPPAFEPGRKFPRNVRFEFCDSTSWTNKRWDEHPDNRHAYGLLKRAAALTGRISVMTYYPHYGVCALFPFCSTGVIVDNLRKIAELGLSGNFFEFYPYNNGYSGGTVKENRYLNFADLNLYLFYRFSKDPSLDFDAEVMDFCRHVYGPAADLVKAYHDELLRLSTTDNPYVLRLTSDTIHNKEYGYLTPDNLLKWEKSFDEMTELVKGGDPLFVKNVADLRRTLDLAVYGLWKECVAKHPDYFRDPALVRARIGEPSNPVWATSARDFLTSAELNIKYLGKEKPLPAQFAGIPPERIRRVVPTNHARCPQMSDVPKIVPDNDAAFGYAASVDRPDLPFRVGCYDIQGKARQCEIRIAKDEIVPDAYRLYHLGKVRPTQKCLVWFGYSWSTSYEPSLIWDPMDAMAQYDCWVSLKFPKDYAAGKNELVLCDQIILVKEEK